MNIIINNPNNLLEKEIDKIIYKSRAIIINDDDNILICLNNGTFMLPGGKKKKNESIDEALIREVYEETGNLYNISDIDSYLTLIDYQKDYPTMHGDIINRKIITNFYIIYDNITINYNNRKLTDREKNSFNYKYIKKENLNELLSITTNNPRKVFFDNELKIALEGLVISKKHIKK